MGLKWVFVGVLRVGMGCLGCERVRNVCVGGSRECVRRNGRLGKGREVLEGVWKGLGVWG